MSRKQCTRRKEKYFKQQRDAGLLRPSKSDDNRQSHIDTESREILLLNFKFDDDPVDTSRSPQIQQWTEAGYDALQPGKGREAEVLFKKCLEAGEDAPDIMNNLAAA